MIKKRSRGPKPRPHPLFDAVRAELGLNSDGELAERIGYGWHQVVMVRNGRCRLSDEMMVCIHEETGLPISEIKRLRDMEAPPRPEPSVKPEKVQRLNPPPNHPFVDRLREAFDVRSDIALARRLGFAESMFCKIRLGMVQVSDEMVLTAHIESGIPISELKALRSGAATYRPTRGEAQTYKRYPLGAK